MGSTDRFNRSASHRATDHCASAKLVEWDHLDFLAWADPHSRGRGYIVAEIDG
ncbi:FBP domain-containing protein, partial [Microbacterium sp. NPDC003461]